MLQFQKSMANKAGNSNEIKKWEPLSKLWLGYAVKYTFADNTFIEENYWLSVKPTIMPIINCIIKDDSM